MKLTDQCRIQWKETHEENKKILMDLIRNFSKDEIDEFIREMFPAGPEKDRITKILNLAGYAFVDILLAIDSETQLTSRELLEIENTRKLMSGEIP